MIRIILVFSLLFAYLFANTTNFNNIVLKLYNNNKLINLSNSSVNNLKSIKIARLKFVYDVLYIPLEYYINKNIIGYKPIKEEDLTTIKEWRKYNYKILKNIYIILGDQLNFIAHIELSDNLSNIYMEKYKNQVQNELKFINTLVNNSYTAIKTNNLQILKPYLNMFKNTYYLRRFQEYMGRSINFQKDIGNFKSFLNNLCYGQQYKKCLTNIGNYYDNGNIYNNYFTNSYQCFTNYIKSKNNGNLYCLIRFNGYYKNTNFYYNNIVKLNQIVKKISSNDLLNVYKINSNSFIFPSNIVLLKLFIKNKNYLSKNKKHLLFSIYLKMLNDEKNYITYLMGTQENLKNVFLPIFHMDGGTKQLENIFLR